MDETKTLTQFERDVVDWILRGDASFLEVLRQQVTAASVSAREFTGVGFYVDLVFPDDVSRLDESFGTELDLTIGNVGAVFEDVNVEAGFVLFVTGGRIDVLEGYTYGNVLSPFRRDLPALPPDPNVRRHPTTQAAQTSDG